jgi:hypothetical protein
MDKINITYIIRMKETIEPLAIIEDVKDAEGERSAPYHDNNWDLVYLRNTRNSLLQLTDKYLLSDYPVSDEKRYEIIEYRQYLRNFININQEGILNGVIPEILPIPF